MPEDLEKKKGERCEERAKSVTKQLPVRGSLLLGQPNTATMSTSEMDTAKRRLAFQKSYSQEVSLTPLPPPCPALRFSVWPVTEYVPSSTCNHSPWVFSLMCSFVLDNFVDKSDNILST